MMSLRKEWIFLLNLTSNQIFIRKYRAVKIMKYKKIGKIYKWLWNQLIGFSKSG